MALLYGRVLRKMGTFESGHPQPYRASLRPTTQSLALIGLKIGVVSFFGYISMMLTTSPLTWLCCLTVAPHSYAQHSEGFSPLTHYYAPCYSSH